MLFSFEVLAFASAVTQPYVRIPLVKRKVSAGVPCSSLIRGQMVLSGGTPMMGDPWYSAPGRGGERPGGGMARRFGAGAGMGLALVGLVGGPKRLTKHDASYSGDGWLPALRAMPNTSRGSSSGGSDISLGKGLGLATATGGSSEALAVAAAGSTTSL